MTSKNPSSQLFFLLSAAAGFLIALILYYLLQNNTDEPISATNNLPLPQEEVSRSPANQPRAKSTQIISFAPAVNRAAPAVVNIFTRKRVKHENTLYNNATLRALIEKRSPPSQYREENNLGSGVIVSSQGHILTNNHVISGAQDIEVLLKDGRYLQASIVGRDLETDLALLKVSAAKLSTIQFGDSSNLQVGDIVLAIGNPFGLGNTVTSGIISALNRSQFRANSFDNFIQTDAAINPGNSGGALVNTQGEMIGLNTINISNSGGSQGIGFAIPSSLVREIMYQLITYGEVRRGWIGIEAKEISPMLAQQLNSESSHALLIIGVLQNGPSQKAGINAGDIITHINNIKISSAKMALDLITNLRPGEVAILRGMRRNQSLQFKVIAEERPQMSGS
ncbi:MAG: trypsin-like peptidase domain-containing protein [gamma proteobacterium symbiont of Bathyaustriella thionipta]|nr:trypsin-like peptidase domain-containing protein [gamma proteobacterium symbiont of Bathyaustriella thionipta]MCU7948415.1 trypsin-like peptidase domain-containing protein [gamma proteobacterium symbiont of Bathyaustriella thionipta]MCU7954114.1 trypsin-like peptidase domain-containing protein [gamma proteobacterium symbiont of Bathyaustriella thionipta]MCU7955407.1 trypsin-like peptidase domain-containing protein [gamma proteobacterium symbiont of Bathyaustriella thionipta]MCU7966758.1 tryp